jgi:hypothetical protein
LVRAAMAIVGSPLATTGRNDHLSGLGPIVTDRNPKTSTESQILPLHEDLLAGAE